MKKLLILLLTAYSLFGQFKFQRSLDDRYVVVHVRGNGENNSTRILDVSNNNTTITAQGAGKLYNGVTSKFYNTALYCDGNTGFFTFPNLDYGSNSFTIEFWYYVVVNKNYNILYATNRIYGSGVTALGFEPLGQSTGVTLLYVSLNGSSWTLIAGQTTNTLVAGAWYHYAMVRNADTWTLYIDGKSVWTSTGSGSIYKTAGSWHSIGNSNTTTWTLNGYIQDFKVSMNVARYTAPFIPPNKPY
jgi:hypothetical protein